MASMTPVEVFAPNEMYMCVFSEIPDEVAVTSAVCKQWRPNAYQAFLEAMASKIGREAFRERLQQLHEELPLQEKVSRLMASQRRFVQAITRPRDLDSFELNPSLSLLERYAARHQFIIQNHARFAPFDLSLSTGNPASIRFDSLREFQAVFPELGAFPKIANLSVNLFEWGLEQESASTIKLRFITLMPELSRLRFVENLRVTLEVPKEGEIMRVQKESFGSGAIQWLHILRNRKPVTREEQGNKEESAPATVRAIQGSDSFIVFYQKEQGVIRECNMM